jgi:hypothetical protein
VSTPIAPVSRCKRQPSQFTPAVEKRRILLSYVLQSIRCFYDLVRRAYDLSCDAEDGRKAVRLRMPPELEASAATRGTHPATPFLSEVQATAKHVLDNTVAASALLLHGGFIHAAWVS